MSESGVHNLKSMADFKAVMEGSPTALNTTADTASSLAVVDFFATWCPPCKAIAPQLVKYSQQYEGKARFFKVDVDEVPDAAQEAGVSAMPTFLFFKNGEKVGEVVGAVPPKIEQMLKEHAA
ncbi:hypothetical protein FQN54_006187 [Arachnomyces sp. PD_36]|nr:hypothetical protein FQN54_006187 [Arachnomyces sp. PD_36]